MASAEGGSRVGQILKEGRLLGKGEGALKSRKICLTSYMDGPQVNDHAMVAAWREGRGGGRGKGAASADSQKETVMTLM